MEVERDASSYLIGRRIGSSFTNTENSFVAFSLLKINRLIIHFFVVSSSSISFSLTLYKMV